MCYLSNSRGATLTTREAISALILVPGSQNTYNIPCRHRLIEECHSQEKPENEYQTLNLNLHILTLFLATSFNYLMLLWIGSNNYRCCEYFTWTLTNIHFLRLENNKITFNWNKNDHFKNVQ